MMMQAVEVAKRVLALGTFIYLYNWKLANLISGITSQTILKFFVTGAIAYLIVEALCLVLGISYEKIRYGH